jgi:hypothetical protein
MAVLGEHPLVGAHPADGVGAHRLQQAVPGGALAAVDHHEGAVHQFGEQVEGVGLDGFDRVEPEPPDEHRHPPQERPLGLVDEVVAPVQGGGQRVVMVPGTRYPGARGAGAAGVAQQREPVGQPGRDVGDGQCGGPRRGQLDRQRQPVEVPTQRGDQRQLFGRHRHPGVVAHQVGEHSGGGVGRERRHRMDHLAGQPQRLPARGQHPQPRAGRQQPGQQRRTLGVDVLAVVQHQQGRRVAAQVADQPLGRVDGAVVAEGQGGGHRLGQPLRMVDDGQVDEPGVAPLGGGDRQPGLAAPGRPHQRHQSPGRERGAHGVDRLAAAHERGERLGQRGGGGRRLGW